MPKHVLTYLLVGLAAFGLSLALNYWGGPLIATAQVGAADAMFVHRGGLRLGERPADDRIVLVLLDYDSAKKLGYVSIYENDAQVMRNLVKAGASVVYDTRMLAAADDKTFSKFEPLFTEMLKLNTESRVMRDIWLGMELDEKLDGKFEPIIAQNVVNTHPHANKSIETRLFPLAQLDEPGPIESAPLVIWRHVLGLPRGTGDEVKVSLRDAGILSAWHKFAPNDIPASDLPPVPYKVGDRTINWHPFAPANSLVPPAGFWVSYDPPAADYKTFSFGDIWEGADPKDFKDKIVLLGFEASIDPSSDTYEIPNLSGKASASHLIACALQTLLDGRTMVQVPKKISIPVAGLLIVGAALVTGLLKPIQGPMIAAGMLLAYFAFTVWLYRGGWFPDVLVTPLCAVMASVGGGLGNAWFNLRDRRRVIDLFGRYVPRAVVNQLMLQPELESLRLGGEVREVTVLFADIRGFTTFSEDLPPNRVVSELNSLLEIMVACTFENEGTLDKFIGDAILVLFNAPLDQTDHTLRAVRTAVAIQQRLTGHGSGLKVGIGVHRGQAVVGNIGTAQRMEYTAIGSTVNLAARLCEFAKPGDVVISQDVLVALDGQFAIEPLGSITVKGVTKQVEVSRVEAVSDTLGQL